MKWFKHYSNAHDNNDLTKVRMKYGATGYAIYWYCLELIAGDLSATNTDNINFELQHDAEVIGFNLKIDTLLVEEIMLYMVRLGLFAQAEDTITCLNLAKYLDKKTTRNKYIHSIIDAANKAKSVPDSPRQSPTKADVSGTSPLDRDRDIERIRNRTISLAGQNAIFPVDNFSPSQQDHEYIFGLTLDAPVEHIAMEFRLYHKDQKSMHNQAHWSRLYRGWFDNRVVLGRLQEAENANG